VAVIKVDNLLLFGSTGQKTIRLAYSGLYFLHLCRMHGCVRWVHSVQKIAEWTLANLTVLQKTWNSLIWET
jgi:hypothetical protein